MSVALDSGKVFDLARKLAKEGAEKFGEEFWTVRDVHINAARRQLAAESGATMKKIVTAPTAEDEELLRKATEAQLAHLGLAGHQRIEFGDVPIEGGRVMVAHDQGADVVVIHGHSVRLGEVAIDLRDAFLASSASYMNSLQDQELQVKARALIGVVVQALMTRHDDFIGAEVKRRLQAQRYD